MKRSRFLLFTGIGVLLVVAVCCVCVELLRTDTKVVDVRDYGIVPGGDGLSGRMGVLMGKVQRWSRRREVVLRFEGGVYDFAPEGAEKGEFYISNHDHKDSLAVGMWLRGVQNVTVEGNGARMVMHGEILPIAVADAEGVVLRNLSIDYARPNIVQVKVVENRGDSGLVFELASFYNYRLHDGALEVYDGERVCRPYCGIAFEGESGHPLYGRADLGCDLREVRPTSKGRVLHAPHWVDKGLEAGVVVCLRTWGRPTPGIFLDGVKNVCVERVKVFYADGMGLLAQGCGNVTLDGFEVRRGEGRYFTTQADGTHFSGCRGRIVSRNGVYEGMMDDAINVHGTYLQVTGVEGDSVVVARFMHGQSFGLRWGEKGDTVQLVDRQSMCGRGVYRVESICPLAGDEKYAFRIGVDGAVDSSWVGCGLENLSWTAEVEFSGNVVRDNRARGALFSTPKHVAVKDNVFDHVSGSAILLCGDCNGWYESGACKDVEISGNVMRDVLTSRYQFCEAAVTVFPVIPCLKDSSYFHENVRIIGNRFETFDPALVYALSVDGLTVKGNELVPTSDYVPLEKGRPYVEMRQVKNAMVEDNVVDGKPM